MAAATLERRLNSLVAQWKNCNGDQKHGTKCKRCRRGNEASLRSASKKTKQD